MKSLFAIALLFTFMPLAYSAETSVNGVQEASSRPIWAHDIIEMALTGDQEGLLKRISEDSVYASLMDLRNNPDFATVRQAFLELAQYNSQAENWDDRTYLTRMNWMSRVSSGDSSYYSFMQIGRYQIKGSNGLRNYLASLLLGPAEVKVKWLAECSNLSKKHFDDFFYNHKEPRTLNATFSEDTGCRLSEVQITITSSKEGPKKIDLR